MNDNMYLTPKQLKTPRGVIMCLLRIVAADILVLMSKGLTFKNSDSIYVVLAQLNDFIYLKTIGHQDSVQEKIISYSMFIKKLM